jgi:hypothetical protein
MGMLVIAPLCRRYPDTPPAPHFKACMAGLLLGVSIAAGRDAARPDSPESEWHRAPRPQPPDEGENA